VGIHQEKGIRQGGTIWVKRRYLLRGRVSIGEGGGIRYGREGICQEEGIRQGKSIHEGDGIHQGYPLNDTFLFLKISPMLFL